MLRHVAARLFGFIPLDNQEERSVPLDNPEEAGECDVHIAKSGERSASAFW
jgi:hypothetical protein